METTIYLIRHSKTEQVSVLKSNDNLQIKNEKSILSIEGEELAKKKFKNKEFLNIDAVFSSFYVRTIATAKYLAKNNNLKVNIVDDLGERRFGITSWDEFPTDFGKKQFDDENYKLGNGESQKEVRERMYSVILEILKEYQGKRVAVVSHSTALEFLLRKWCIMDEYEGNYVFNNKIIFSGKWDYCQSFKLVFNGKELISIEVVE